MLRIVKSATLTALRTDAAQLPSLQRRLAAAEAQAAELRQDAEQARAASEAAQTASATAHAEAERVRAKFAVLENDRVIGLAALRDAARDPSRQASVRGLVATRLIREEIAAAKSASASTGKELDFGLQFLDMLIGDDDGTTTEPAATESVAAKPIPTTTT